MTVVIAPIIFAIASFLLRVINLGIPKGFVFDELYYVDGARDFLKFGVEVNGVEPEFIVHPPIGKWLIAGGIHIFGDNEFGWRIASALFGTFIILLFARFIHLLFNSQPLTAIGAGLISLDGLLLVHSRTALLDLFLTFFTLLGVYFWYRKLHWLAGISLGLAIGCKWSAIYFIALIVFISLYRILVKLDIRESIKPILNLSLQYLITPIIIYTISWFGWFKSDQGWARYWSPNVLFSWFHYHAEMLKFHIGLTEQHPYQANPWSWLIMGRPTSFFYADPKNCGTKNCAQEVLALGTPMLWWAGVLAIAVVLTFWVKSLLQRRSDPAASIVILGLTAGYLPWFGMQQRTTFTFYAIIFEPFLILAIVYSVKVLFESSLKPQFSKFLVGLFLGLIVICFVFFLPLFTGEVITYEQWQMRMWLDSWI